MEGVGGATRDYIQIILLPLDCLDWVPQDIASPKLMELDVLLFDLDRCKPMTTGKEGSSDAAVRFKWDR